MLMGEEELFPIPLSFPSTYFPTYKEVSLEKLEKTLPLTPRLVIILWEEDRIQN